MRSSWFSFSSTRTSLFAAAAASACSLALKKKKHSSCWKASKGVRTPGDPPQASPSRLPRLSARTWSVLVVGWQQHRPGFLACWACCCRGSTREAPRQVSLDDFLGLGCQAASLLAPPGVHAGGRKWLMSDGSRVGGHKNLEFTGDTLLRLGQQLRLEALFALCPRGRSGRCRFRGASLLGFGEAAAALGLGLWGVCSRHSRRRCVSRGRGAGRRSAPCRRARSAAREECKSGRWGAIGGAPRRRFRNVDPERSEPAIEAAYEDQKVLATLPTKRRLLPAAKYAVEKEMTYR